MRCACAALLLCAVAAGCRFSVQASDFDAGVGGDMAMGVELGVDLGGCACANGCSATPTLHCLALQPTGPVTANDYGQGVGAMTAGGDVTFNTDDGSITGAITRMAGAGLKNGIGFRVASQGSNPGVGVFSFAGFTLNAGAHMIVKGNNAFAMASSAAVQINGVVDGACVSASNSPGPGGSAGGVGGDGSGAGAGQAGASTGGASGGGGAGYGDSGGNGGLIPSQTTNLGAIWGDLVAPTFVLVGGSGGGAGGNNGGDGGGGGGAVQFAVNDSVTVAGTIHVGGCGGRHSGGGKGGGGGGAGGAIVIEASTITLTPTAVLSANGGGGAAGDDKSSDGSPGLAATMPAPGGTTTSANGGSGGDGGASNAPKTGQRYTHGRDGLIPAPNKSGGGGGGGCGRIALRTLSGVVGDSSTAVTPDAADINTPPNQHMTFYGMASFQ